MHKYDEYKGHPMIVLAPDSDYPFKFGRNKAKLILENLEAIRQFAEGSENDYAAPQTQSGDIPF